MGGQVNFAKCRCGGRIFERVIGADSAVQWAHVEPFAPHDLTRCPDGLSALPMVGTQTNPPGRRF